MRKKYLFTLLGISLLNSAEAISNSNLHLLRPCTPDQSAKAGYDLDYLISSNGWIFREFLFNKQVILSRREIEFSSLLNKYLNLKGSKLIIVPIPNKPLISSREINYDASDAEKYFRNEITGLNTAGLDAIDLLDIAKNNYYDQHNGIKFMTKNDFHWSAYGAKVSAEAIARDIKSSSRYASLEKFNFVTTSKIQKNLGNLGSEIETRCNIHVAPEIVLNYVTKNVTYGRSLLGDAEPSIAILGTSFSSDKNFNFEGAIKAETNLDTINFSISGGGKYAAMESFFSDANNLLHPPAFIIWEFPNYSAPEDERAEKLLKILSQLP